MTPKLANASLSQIIWYARLQKPEKKNRRKSNRLKIFFKNSSSTTALLGSLRLSGGPQIQDTLTVHLLIAKVLLDP